MKTLEHGVGARTFGQMASTVWTACPVSLLVIGLCFASVLVNAATARGGGGAPSAAAELHVNDQHRQLCPLIAACTEWCSYCSSRTTSNLLDSFDEHCHDWKSRLLDSTSYKDLVRCTKGHPSNYTACFCTNLDKSCRKCEHSEGNNLTCFSQENGNTFFTPTGGSTIFVPQAFQQLCPTCSCSTEKPTTPEVLTTRRPQTITYHPDNIGPRPEENPMTTTAGDAVGPDKVTIIAATVGGGTALILLILACVCLWRKCVLKQPKRSEEEYVYIDDMQTFRSQAPMMNSTNATLNDGIHPPCGHRAFNNEVYNLNGISNMPTSTDIPPELPGNHPPPIAPYQELSRGSRVRRDDGNTAMGSGPCPHCRQMVNDRSATAPLLDRPRGEDELTTGVEGSKNPYMALIKSNTCPTPAAPTPEPMCSCHARPLSECSSKTGSVLSDQRDSHSQATSTLNSIEQESNHRPMSSSSDIQESPYYFKMEPLGEEGVSSPKSPQYLKLEDAQTLPLDGETTPMLSNPDPNANDLHVKSVPDDPDVGPPGSPRKEQLPDSEKVSDKVNDNGKQAPSIFPGTEGAHSEFTPKGKLSTDGLSKHVIAT